jgi:hypothetical protein
MIEGAVLACFMSVRHLIPMFKAAKDALASEAARRYVNGLIARYGKVEELRIDSRRHQMKAVCHLDGENVPIVIDVGNYVIRDHGEKKSLEITAIACSRVWLERLLEDHVRGRSIDLPSWAAAAL